MVVKYWKFHLIVSVLCLCLWDCYNVDDIFYWVRLPLLELLNQNVNLNLTVPSRKQLYNFNSSQNIRPQLSVASYARVVSFVRDFPNFIKNMHHVLVLKLFNLFERINIHYTDLGLSYASIEVSVSKHLYMCRNRIMNVNK